MALVTAAVVAISLGVGLMMLAFGGARPGGPLAGPLDKGTARQMVETAIAQTPEYARYFARLRETFTPDYEMAIEDFATRLSDTKMEQSADYYLSEAVRRLRQARGGLAGKAEPDKMALVFAKQLDVLRAVAQQDKKLCVAFLYGATNLDFQRFASTRRPLVADMATASLEAMANGRDKKIERPQPSEADFKVLEKALADRGLNRAEIDSLLDGKMPDPPFEDARSCALGQTYLEVLPTLPEAARARIYALALELMAKS